MPPHRQVVAVFALDNMSNPPNRYFVKFEPQGYLARSGSVTVDRSAIALFDSKERALTAIRASVYSVLIWKIQSLEANPLLNAEGVNA